MARANARYLRTIVLGVIALGGLIYTAADQFGIPWENIGWMLLYTLLAVLCIIAVAACAVACWLGLRKLLQRDS